MPGRTAFNWAFRDRAFSFTKNLKYNGYQRGLVSIFLKFFGENASSGGGIKN